MKPAVRLLLLFAAVSILSQFPARAEGGKISCSGTSMQYSIEGGRLKRVKDDERDRTVSHNYEGEIKPGETITIRYAGLSAMKSAGGNDGAVAINPMAKKRKIEGMLKEAPADAGQGRVSGHLSYTVEPDVVRIDVYVTFTSYTYSPMVGLAPFTTSAWVTYTVVEAEPKKPAEEKRQSTGTTTSPGYSNDDDGGGDKDYEEDNEASFVTEVIPYLIPAAVIAAIIGITVSAGNKKKGNGGKNKKQDASQDDQPYYSMHFYKNFGNTIIAGEPPQKIYARIQDGKGRRYARRDADIDDPDLLWRLPEGRPHGRVERMDDGRRVGPRSGPAARGGHRRLPPCRRERVLYQPHPFQGLPAGRGHPGRAKPGLPRREGL